MADRVYIFDTTLRDGEQSPGCSMTVPEKLRMAAKLVDLGVDILEAGFPIASEGDFEAVDAVAREFPWVNVAALARSNKLDVERAAAVAQERQAPAHSYLYRHQRHPSEVQAEEIAAAGSGRSRGGGDARSRLCATTSSFQPKTPRAPIGIIWKQVSQAVVAAGARTVNLPDTVGFSVPDEYGALIGRMVKALGDTAIVSVHCHDDLGLAVANSLAAVQDGARQIECTINGIGERAGNAALEEVVMAMQHPPRPSAV